MNPPPQHNHLIGPIAVQQWVLRQRRNRHLSPAIAATDTYVLTAIDVDLERVAVLIAQQGPASRAAAWS